MNRVTLRELADMFKSLPDTVQDKPIGWLDISHPTKEQIEELKDQLAMSSETYIEGCAN